MTSEQLKISNRKQKARERLNYHKSQRQATIDEIKRIQKLCRKTYPKGHVYEWHENSSLSGGCFACVGCGRRKDGLSHLDKNGVKLYD